MALKLMKEADQPLPPHHQALKDNLRAIKDARAKVMAIVEKDRAAASDVAAADATAGRIQTLQEAIDTANAEASYSGGPPPDLRHMEKQLADAQQLHNSQSARARAAANVRVKYTADMTSLNAILSNHARETRRLTWLAAQEELESLAVEFLAQERDFLDVHRRAFAAALVCDSISLEQAFGSFVGSGNMHDLHISRPAHAPFDANPDLVTVEAAHAARKAYVKSVCDGAAALELQLLAIAD